MMNKQIKKLQRVIWLLHHYSQVPKQHQKDRKCPPKAKQE